MERYICIHGHFYQPPRENPWLEAIELQDSAYPYHDWNERIAAECYACNAASRIKDGDGRIVDIVNNYARISFNFGPTLLSWMEEKMPATYEAILAADQESQKLFSGHGSALAQVYNHIILPLANRRDKETQVRWGIQDFVHRFQRQPEGMWLAETAADLETLEVLVDHGITFTILSPYQAHQVRPIGETIWSNVSGARIDPTMPYIQHLPSGRSIYLFFYDAPISQGVAFEGLLEKGENLANRLLGAFSEKRFWPQLVHIATDGETYGHHHRLGDMALAYALHYIETRSLAKLTIYGEYLEKHPPTHEVNIFENSSWSCAHGIERWYHDCGCNSGGYPHWNQQWRAPLRDALDWLRDSVNQRFEKQARKLFQDPWLARDKYIHVILDRSSEQIDQFLQQHQTRSLSQLERSTALKLMELQRNAMFMYTSCGWFFDELSGIETVQIIQYAARVIQLASNTFRSAFARVDDIEAGFIERIQKAKSNIPEHEDGKFIYENFVKPAMVDLKKVVAHYALSSLFENYQQATKIYCYMITCEDCQVFESGRTSLKIGRAKITSDITQETALLNFAVLHLGDHNMTGGVREYKEEIYDTMVREISEAFNRADITDAIRLVDKHFQGLSYSLRTLFRDEQRSILKVILKSSLDGAEAAYRQIYQQHAPLMRFLADLHAPQPRAFLTAAEFVLNTDLRRAFENKEQEIERSHVQAMLDEVQREGIELDTTGLAYTFQETLVWMEQAILANPTNGLLLKRINAFVGLADILPFEVNFWKIQNIYYQIHKTVFADFQEKAKQDDQEAKQWIALFIALGEKLGFRVEEMRRVY